MSQDKQLAIEVTFNRLHGRWNKGVAVEAKVVRVYPNGDEAGSRYDEYPHKDIVVTAGGNDDYRQRGLVEWTTAFNSNYHQADLARLLPVVAALQKVEAALQKAEAPDTFAAYLLTVVEALGIKRAVLVAKGFDPADGAREERTYFKRLSLLGAAVQKLESDWQADAARREADVVAAIAAEA